MDFKIPLGVKHKIEVKVTDDLSAKSFGSGLVNVFATPAMIALMEKTAMESILELLPKGYTTVGTEVNIKHLKATAIGKHVIAESYLKSANGNKIIFELHAFDEKGMIGIGTHTRVIIEEKSFMERLK
jgi:predicted thioesterase